MKKRPWKTRIGKRASPMVRRVSALSIVLFGAAAAGSAPTYTLIIGTGVELGPIQGLPSMLGLVPVNGLITDLNADGAPDIVIGINGTSPVVYLSNATTSPFQNVQGSMIGPIPGPSTPIMTWGAVVAADVNNDGHPDLATAGFNAPNLIYLNNGTSNPFDAVSGIAIGTGDVGGIAPAFGDVNGDGFPDMAIPNTNHVPSRLYLTNGAPLTSGGYSTVQIGTDVGYGQEALIADVNGDGKPDLILTYIVASASATDPSGVAIYLNNGSNDPFGNVTPVRLLIGQSVDAIAVADLNGDGKLDLVASVSNAPLTQNDLYVFLNQGSSSLPFASPQTLQPDADLGGGCLGVSVGDVNGDGLPDLLFACTAPAPTAMPLPANPAVGAIYLNNGTANPFANVTPVDFPTATLGAYARSAIAGILVKNAAPDILVVESTIVTGGQAGLASYSPTELDQNPSAQNDSAVCATGKPVTISVLANDAAGPGQTINATSVMVTTAPQHGTATVDAASGSVIYQPNVGYSGTDSVQYTVADGVGVKSNVATVNVRVQPAPVASNDTDTLQTNQSATINVLSNDASSGGTLVTSSIAVVVPPAHGTATAMNGEVVYTPTVGYSGLDTFQYTVLDNLGTASNVATVSIDVTAPPVVAAPSHGGGGSLDDLVVACLAALLAVRVASLRTPTPPRSTA